MHILLQIMGYTFKSDDRMVITIPLSKLNVGSEGQLLPDTFHCVFKDVYKVFLQGNPKALGTAQAMAGLLIISLGVLLAQTVDVLVCTVPSVLFIVSGMLSYAAGHSPNMCMTKVSFSFNIISFFWAFAAMIICSISLAFQSDLETVGIHGMISVLIVLELVVAVMLIYWESKAVCREHFNILPVVNLTHE
ncbi:hypothetical protein AAFF_G00403900 [Aldrovandia affinis]|uniref:Uncharacterized protein n=1 Tax=Aldrovandia affinis TaxID=143900 RepID=A0AAD7T8L1_9TELE|nr:hypothetical protein AAFF_G00403900 [Aldrovandia affinis]